MGKTIQIRDVDDRTYTILRTRAAAEHLSLTSYLRRQLDDLANSSPMADWVSAATRRDWGVGHNVIADTIRESRDEGEL